MSIIMYGYSLSEQCTTYLDVPPPIACPWFSVEALVFVTVMFVQMLRTPDEVGGD